MARISNYSCLFIGDSKFDLKCSDNANIPCILLSHGYSNINIKNLNPYKVANNLKRRVIIKSIFLNINFPYKSFAYFLMLDLI